MGNGDPDVDDQEITFPRGGGWEPRGQPLPPPAPTQPGGGWEPRGQPPHPQHPLNLMRMWDTLSTHWPWDCDLEPLI